MTRVARNCPGGVIFHVLNRGVDRMRLFDAEADYRAFDRVLDETLAIRPIRLLAYCLMPNHWHLLLWPRHDRQLAALMQRLTITHVRRWVEFRRDVGNGHVYQGRYKSFPVQSDPHLLDCARYVERNPLRAGLVRRAEDWPYSSLSLRGGQDATRQLIVHEWPIARPADWVAWVNQPQTDAEVEAVRRCVRRGQPFGDAQWVERTARDLDLAATLRPRGRPRKPRSDGGGTE